jgi:hypothetical protein
MKALDSLTGKALEQKFDEYGELFSEILVGLSTEQRAAERRLAMVERTLGRMKTEDQAIRAAGEESAQRLARLMNRVDNLEVRVEASANQSSAAVSGSDGEDPVGKLQAKVRRLELVSYGTAASSLVLLAVLILRCAGTSSFARDSLGRSGYSLERHANRP